MLRNSGFVALVVVVIAGCDDPAGGIFGDPQSLGVTSPNGGEELGTGRTFDITWTAAGIPGDVDIHYSTDGGATYPDPVNLVATVPATDGSYTWTNIPNDPSLTCRVRVREAGGGGVEDESDADFTIAVPSITVTAPNGTETWDLGSTQTITWTSVAVENVKIELFRNGAWEELEASAADTGSYDWALTGAPASDALVRVSDASDPAVSDESDAAFTIAGIMVTAPDGGEFWAIAGTETITWVAVGVAGDVNVHYSTDSGATYPDPANLMATVPATDGSYTWTVPDDASTQCRVRVSEVSGALEDESDADFTITPPMIRVTAPNGGEELGIGRAFDITWVAPGIAGDVDIHYSTDGGTTYPDPLNLVATVPATDASYTWTNIPNDPGLTCRVRVREAGGGGLEDESDADFTIVLPSITVTAPNGAETWDLGSTQAVTWTSAAVENVRIELFRNGAWEDLEASAADTGSYSWDVTGAPASDALVRVSDASDPAVSDESDAAFTIAGIMVTAPTGGETWDLGATEPITWTSAGVQNVKIALFRNGAWEELQASVGAAAGSYDWTLEGAPAPDALVRVTDLADAAVWDESGAAFTMRGILVTAPNGGETLTVGGSFTVTWVSAGLTGDVRIRYSTDSGDTYPPGNTIATVPATDGAYAWTNIPNDPSPTCRVRVRDRSGTGLEDESDADFTIQ